MAQIWNSRKIDYTAHKLTEISRLRSPYHQFKKAIVVLTISFYSMYQMYLWLPDWDYSYPARDYPLDADGYYVKVSGEECGFECVKGFQLSYLPLVIIALLLYQRRYVSIRHAARHMHYHTATTMIIKIIFIVHWAGQKSRILLLFLYDRLVLRLSFVWPNGSLHRRKPNTRGLKSLQTFYPRFRKLYIPDSPILSSLNASYSMIHTS